MQYLIRIMSVSMVALIAVTVAAADPTNPGSDASAAKVSEPNQTSDTTNATKSSGESWRYRQHDGRWWYWMPSKQWVVWNGSEWVKYDPQTIASVNRQRAYSYPGSGSYSTTRPSGGQGFWGPVIYNHYGVRQYPYSARSRGIQQLGPVPAMGGVRSLPGWGGER